MKTTYYTSLLVMSCMLIGFLAAGIIFFKAHNIDESQSKHQATRYNKTLVHEAAILTRQWLITLDLYLNSKEHYLYQGLLEQADAIYYLNNQISDNKSISNVSLRMTKVIKKCSFFHRSETRVIDENQWSKLIDETDSLTLDLLKPLENAEKVISKKLIAQEAEITLFKNQFYRTIYICPMLFIVFSLIMLRWSHRIIVKPIETLIEMANQGKIQEIKLNNICPSEIKTLASSLDKYIHDMNEAKELSIKEVKRTEYANILLRNIMETAVDAIICTNESGQIIQMNDSFRSLAKYSDCDKAIVNLNDFIPNLNLSDFGHDTLDHLINFQETRLHTKEEHILPIEISISSFSNDHKDFYTIIIRDISSRIAMQNQLLQSQKLESIGRLSAGIAHEINTPIQYIMDYHVFLKDSCHDLLDFIQSVYLIDDKNLLDLAESMDLDFILAEIPKAIEGSLHGLREISDIVKSVKVMSHPIHKNKTFYNLNKLIRGAATISKSEWKYEAKIEYDLDENLPDILCFPSFLNQTFVNLIVNAAHAIHTKNLRNESTDLGVIKITSKFTESHITIEITDSGQGINSDIMDKIFEPFFTTKDVGIGTGQGLALVYDFIVLKHQGKIYCESKEMQGTTFFINLPLEQASEANF